MLSSQVKGEVGGERLATIRRRIADRLESLAVDDSPVIHVWLSEAQGALGEDATAWDTCMAEARRCDVLAVLYTGRAGWVREGLGIGICHAEWETGFARTPQKVRVVRFDGPTLDALKETPQSVPGADRRFYEALEDAQVWRVDANTVDEFVDKGVEAVWWAITDLVRTGRLAGSRGRNLVGESLRWANLDFNRREEAMLRGLTRSAAQTSHFAPMRYPGRSHSPRHAPRSGSRSATSGSSSTCSSARELSARSMSSRSSKA
jgi:hypothetical protein